MAGFSTDQIRRLVSGMHMGTPDVDALYRNIQTQKIDPMSYAPPPQQAPAVAATSRMGAPSTAGLPRLQAPALPGMVPGATGIPRAPVGSPTSSGNGGLIDFLGNMAGNTTLGGIFKSLFPDAWYGAGEAIKGGLGGLPQLGQPAPSLPRSLTPSQSYAATNAAAAANPKYRSTAWRMGEDSGADKKGGSLLS